MGLDDYISRQPNQKAKSNTQFDEEFMVATISRIRDPIKSFFCHSNKISFHKWHTTSKYKLQAKTRVHSFKLAKSSTHISNASNNSFTTRAKVNNYNSKLIAAFNCHANHLIKTNTALTSQIHSPRFNCNSTATPEQKVHHITMSTNESSQNSPTASPQTPRETFRTHSTPIATTSTSNNNNTQASLSPENRDIELSREEIFENNPNQLFTKSFLAVLTSKDAVLKEIRDCVIQDDEARCKEVSPYVHSFWKDLHVKSGCLCVDQRVAIPNSIKEAVLESIHMTHPSSWGMISLFQYA